MHLAEPYIAGFFLWRLQRAIFFQFVAASLLLLVAGLSRLSCFPRYRPGWPANRCGISATSTWVARWPYISPRSV
jgi:hypothetical protein